MPHASNPLRLTHTSNFPCMKTISKTKDFCFSSHESFIGHTPIIMLDHPPKFFIGHTPKILWTSLRYFHWTYSENTVDNPPIYFFHWTHSENTVDNPPIFSLDTLRKYCGQHSENTMDNPPIFSLDILRKYCGQYIGHTLIIMLDNHPIKIACSKPCRALTTDIRDVPMHVKCDAIAWYLLICMHACINIILTRLHVIQLRNKSCNWIFLSRFPAQKNSMH